MTPQAEVQPVVPADAGRDELPISVVMNSGSGSDDAADARRAIENVLTASGRDARIFLTERPRDLALLAQRAADSRPGILAAAGGDGTLNAVAAVARRRDLPFAAIPLGTFNYFARELGIPLDAGAAARLLVDGSLRRVAVGTVNGRLFLNNASIGLYRRLIEQRETHKQRFGRNRLVAILSGLVTVLQPHPPYRLRLAIDGQPLTVSSPSVFFGRNALQMERLGLDEAAAVARGELAVLALREVGRRELLGLLLRGAVGNLETAADLHQYTALRVEVERLDRRQRRIRVAIDGELVDCTLPLVVEAVPDALAVIVPRPREGPIEATG